jgi:GT2 family glycosyltransferase
MKDSSAKVILLGLACYRDMNNVETFLEHIKRIELPEGWRIETAIADNCGYLAFSSQDSGQVYVYKPGENLGYLGGCAYAIGQWRSRHNLIPEWTVIANTDISFEKDFFIRLVRLRLPDKVAVLAPDITLQNGTCQNPYMKKRLGKPEMYLYTLIYRSSLLTRSMDCLKCSLCSLREKVKSSLFPNDSLEMDKTQEYHIIYAPHGSCMLLHRTFFEQGGMLNFEGFMYGEEIFIAEEARALGLRVAWVPDLRVVHFQKAATGMVYHTQKRLWRYQSSSILWRKYFSKK